MGLQLSGSVQLEGNLLVTGSANSVFENISVTNRITANEINVQFVSSSIIYSSGSNRFGDEVGDKHQFTGSVSVTGSLNVGGNLNGTSVTFALSNSSVGNATNLNLQQAGSGDVAVSYLLTGTREWLVGVDNSDSDAFKINNITGTSDFNNSGLSIATTGDATFSNSVTAKSGLINGTTDAFFDLNRSASGNASRVRFQTVGTDEFEIGLKGGVPGFHITSGDATELLTISGSNVGVGTNTPGSILHTRDTSGATRIIVDNNANAAAGAGIYMRTLSGGTMISNATVRTDNAGNFSIFTGTTSDTEAMRITPSGSVGIGTATFTTSDFFSSIPRQVNSVSGNISLRLHRPDTTEGAGVGGLSFAGNDGSGNQKDIALIGGETSQSNSGGGALRFLTRANGGSLAEAMRITSERRMLLATTTDTGAVINVSGSYMNYPVSIEAQPGGGQLALTRGGAVGEFYMGGTTGGTTELFVRSGGSGGVRLDAGSTGWVSASDIRLKDIEKPIENAVQSLQGLQTIYYSWKASQDKKLHLGLIAQEVEAVFPEIVSESSIDEMKGVKYTELIPVLIKAIQEQQTQIEELKSRVEQLQNN